MPVPDTVGVHEDICVAEMEAGVHATMTEPTAVATGLLAPVATPPQLVRVKTPGGIPGQSRTLTALAFTPSLFLAPETR